MAYTIKQSKLFLKKVTNLLEYLEENWSKKVADEFKKKLDYKMLHLLKDPSSGKNCYKVSNVRRILVTPHNKLFYRVIGKTIYIITLFDTRQNPEKNKYE
jgi:plasmid stabilization system protein ParE